MMLSWVIIDQASYRAKSEPIEAYRLRIVGLVRVERLREVVLKLLSMTLEGG